MEKKAGTLGRSWFGLEFLKSWFYKPTGFGELVWFYKSLGVVTLQDLFSCFQPVVVGSIGNIRKINQSV